MRQVWPTKKAEELFSISDFVSNGSFASLRENVKYLDYPDYAVLVRLADFSNGFEKRRFVYVNKQSYDYLSKSTLYGGEIIMSNVGSVGKSFICPDLGCPMTVGPNVIVIRSDYNKFFQYYFQTEAFQKQLISISSKATLLKFNKTNFKKLDIPAPPLEVQKHIVSVLDAEFEKIDLLKTHAEKSLLNAKDLFRVAIKKELEPRDGWKEYSLQSACLESGQYGMSVSSKSFDGVRYLRITDITEDGRLNSDLVSADINTIENKYILQDGDILFARTGATVGKTLVYDSSMGICSYAGYLIRYRPNSNIVLPRTLYYITHSAPYYAWVWESQRQSTLPNISAKLYNDFKFFLPDISEQQRIISILDVLKAKCNDLQLKYEKTLALCDDLKQALLRKAFNGEL